MAPIASEDKEPRSQLKRGQEARTKTNRRVVRKLRVDFFKKLPRAGLEGLLRKFAMVFAKGILDFAKEVS